jgi:hypothetical protein
MTIFDKLMSVLASNLHLGAPESDEFIEQMCNVTMSSYISLAMGLLLDFPFIDLAA